MTQTLDLCPRCEKIKPLCVCDSVQPLTTKTHVLILQHPQEPDKELGTARLAHLNLPHSTLRVGLSWPNLRKALGWEETRRLNPKEWVVLYLGSAKPPKTKAPLTLVDKKGQPLEDSEAWLPALKGLVILDGTWSQAKALWWRNAWLLKLHRGVLNPTSPSLYGKLRREPRREGLATIESIALAVSALENRPEISEALLGSFQRLLTQYLAKNNKLLCKDNVKKKT